MHSLIQFPTRTERTLRQALRLRAQRHHTPAQIATALHTARASLHNGRSLAWACAAGYKILRTADK